MQANIKRFIVSITTAGLMLSPALALAQTPAPSGFCARIANVKTELNSKLSEIEKRRTEKRTEITNDLKVKKDERVAKVKETRDEAEENLEEALDDVEEDLTAAQKSALTTFKTTQKRAQATRKAAVDAAVNKYRTDLQALVNKRQEAIRLAGLTLKNSIAAALAKAQADCTAGVDQVTVRTNLKTSIETAQAKFRTDIKAVENIGPQVKALVDTRNAAMKAAKEAFRTTVNQAKEVLKTVLDTSTTPPPVPAP